MGEDLGISFINRRKCNLLIFFKDEESWMKYKDTLHPSSVRKAQWEGGCYIIVSGVDVAELDLNTLKEDPKVYKILYHVEEEDSGA